MGTGTKASVETSDILPILSRICAEIGVRTSWAKEIHLFAALPLALAVLLGTYFNPYPTIQLYEFLNKSATYCPSHRIDYP
jgi:hypothetical protein